MSVWKTLKVFISSTFLDLELARDRLSDLFRVVEKDTFSRQLTVRPYDLRWRDRHSKDEIADWCVRLVEDCEYFIGILGYRYGWRPDKLPGGATNTEKISVTEMEVRTALDKIPKQQRFFCFATFADRDGESAEDIASILSLKKRLVEEGETIYQCNNLQELLENVEKGFRERVDCDYPPGQKVAAMVHTYRDSLREIIEEKVRGFIGRDVYIEQLREFANSSERLNYLALEAVAGTGKSALLATFINTWQQKDTPIIAHFMSMGGDSREVSGIVKSLAEQLQLLGLIQEPLAIDIGDLGSQVRAALEQTTKDLVLVIDGLDEMSESGTNLLWLSKTLPPQVRVIMTLRRGEVWDNLQKFPFLRCIELPPLDNREIQGIIASYVTHHQLNLSPQDQELLHKNAAGNPLFLKVALDEILSSGIAVGQLAVTVTALFDQILNRLEKEFDERFAETSITQTSKEIIDSYLGLIAAGRNGILEYELEEILSLGDDFFFLLSKALQNFVLVRKNFLTFFHPEFERMMKVRQGKSGMRTHYRVLADYLISQGYLYERTLDELPYQLQWSGRYSELMQTLTDLKFLEAKANAGMVIGLRNDFDFALNGTEVKLPENTRIEVAGVGIDYEMIQLLAKALAIDIQFLQRHPQSLLQTLWNLGFWHDCPQAQEYYEVESDECPWQKPGDKLYLLLENWRQQSTNTWLKTLRPLQNRLDSALSKIFRGHKNSVTGVRYSPDAKSLASSSFDNTVCIWDVETGQVIHTLRGHGSSVESVSYSPDGCHLASGSSDNTVRIWDTETGQLQATLTGHLDCITSVCFLNNQYIASGGNDNTVRIWDIKTRQMVEKLQDHQGAVAVVCYTPQQQYLASAGSEGIVRVWNIKTKQLLCELQGHADIITDISFSPNGKFIASASADRTVRIWQIETQQTVRVLQGHKDSVISVCFSPNGEHLVSASGDKTVCVWDIKANKRVGMFYGHENNINSLSYSKNGKHIASGSSDNTVRIWDQTANKFSPVLKGHEAWVNSVSYHPQQLQMASGANDATVKIWDLATGHIVHNLVGHQHPVKDVDYNNNGQLLASGSEDTAVCIWNTSNGELLHTLLGHEHWVLCVRYSPEGQYLASGSGDTTVRIWDTLSGELIGVLCGHENAVMSLSYSPEGRYLASGSYDGTVRIWDMEDGREVYVLKGEENTGQYVCFSPQGGQIASASDDNFIRVWDMQNGQLLHTLEGHQDAVENINYTDDGQYIISCSADNTTRIWDVPSGRCVKVLLGQADPYVIRKNPAYQSLIQPSETLVKNSQNQQDIAFVPDVLQKSAMIDKYLTGYLGSYVCLLELSQ